MNLLSEQDIMLRAESQLRSYLIDVGSDIVIVYRSSATGRCEQSRQYRHRGRLTGAVVTQERCNLPLVKVDGKIVHCSLPVPEINYNRLGYTYSEFNFFCQYSMYKYTVYSKNKSTFKNKIYRVSIGIDVFSLQ